VRYQGAKRGTRARVAALARDNAEQAFRLRFRQPRQEGSGGGELARVLGLPGPARRVECFDISHLGGEDQVASLVVWENGRLRKSEYRSFNVRVGQGADDPAAIGERSGRPLPAQARRRRRACRPRRLIDAVARSSTRARAALDGLGRPVPRGGDSAKRLEDVHRARASPGRSTSSRTTRFACCSSACAIEAHRFAVTRHRRRPWRARGSRRSCSRVPGIGPRRAQALAAQVRLGRRRAGPAAAERGRRRSGAKAAQTLVAGHCIRTGHL